VGRLNAGSAALVCVLAVCGWAPSVAVDPNVKPDVVVWAPASVKPVGCGATAADGVVIVAAAAEKLNGLEAAYPNNDATIATLVSTLSKECIKTAKE